MEIHMVKRDVAIILFKALSIYLFTMAIEYFADRFSNIFRYDNITNAIIIQAIIPTIILLVGGLIILWLAPLFASSIFKSAKPNEKWEFTSYGIQVIAFSTIGLYILVNTLPDLVDTIVSHYMSGFLYWADKETITMIHCYLLSYILKILLGVWLLVGSRGIVKFVNAMRRKG